MTTEDDFHAALDAQPDDWQTRLVLADFLQEDADPRADGYRALAAQARRTLPCRMATAGTPLRFVLGSERPNNNSFRDSYGPCLLPNDWFDLIEGWHREVTSELYWKHFLTRRAAEDAAALAFAKLSPGRRRKLLRPKR